VRVEEKDKRGQMWRHASNSHTRCRFRLCTPSIIFFSFFCPTRTPGRRSLLGRHDHYSSSTTALSSLLTTSSPLFLPVSLICFIFVCVSLPASSSAFLLPPVCCTHPPSSAPPIEEADWSCMAVRYMQACRTGKVLEGGGYGWIAGADLPRTRTS